jgi:hypothetical protein
VKHGEKQQDSRKQGAVPKVVDTATPQTQVNSSMVWIIGDNKHARRKQFENAGLTVGYSKHGSLNKDQRHCLRLRLSTDQPRLLYIVNLGGMGNTEDISNFISVMITDQLNLRGFILLEAPEHSSAWTMPHGKLTESTEWYPVVTRWCGLTAEQKDAKGERVTPSTFSTYVRANFPLKDLRKCNCGTSWNDHSSEKTDSN